MDNENQHVEPLHIGAAYIKYVSEYTPEEISEWWDEWIEELKNDD